MAFLFFAAGLAATVGGAEWLTRGAVWAARRLAIPEILIGATLLSVATTLPELGLSTLAAAAGHSDLAVGNVAGSCSANIGLILGLGVAISGELSARARPFSDKILLAAAASVLAFVLSLDGSLSLRDGLALLAAFAAYAMRIGRSLPRARRADRSGGVPGNWTVLLLGAVFLIGGSRLAVAGGVALARMLGVPEVVIGLTLMAVGTSLPELSTSIVAARRGRFALSMGNVVGANILNLTLILGLSATIRPLDVRQIVVTLHLPAVLFFVLALLALVWVSSRSERWKGATLLALYGAYLWLLLSR